jgi:glycosyltransferase involved in cell wall biosynthesis
MLKRTTDIQVVMLLENNPYPRDVRVRLEAESLSRAGYRVTVIAPRAEGERAHELLRGVQVRRFRTFEGGTSWGFVGEYLVAAIRLQALGAVALLRGAEVLHLHNPPDILFGLAALFRLAGRKVVFDHHDLFPEAIEAKVGSVALGRLALVCERLTFALANHVLSTNSSYAEIARGRGGKDAGAVTVVRNGPPEEWTRSAPESRPGPLSSIKLGYVGAISTQDGVELLAPVLARVRAQGVDPALTVVGDGDARGRFEAALRRHGVADCVTMAGWVPHDQVPGLLRGVDVCLDPAPASALNERSTMIKLAEYIVLGKPVVAFDLLETRRTVGDAALLIAAGDLDAFAQAVVALAQHPERRLELASRARARAPEVVWSHSARALLGAYDQVLTASR